MQVEIFYDPAGTIIQLQGGWIFSRDWIICVENWEKNRFIVNLMTENPETISYSQVPVVKDVVASVKEESEAWVYTFNESFEKCAMTSTGSHITHDMSRD